MSIKHKIKNVSDNVCMGCAQLWEGECRAFEMSHSEEERISRNSSPVLQCMTIERPEMSQVEEALQSIMDLARTDLAPDELSMTDYQWAQRRLYKIALLAEKALGESK